MSSVRIQSDLHRNDVRRALSLVELLLAMTITAMVAAAIAGMLGAVTAGVGSRRDNRTVMVLANAAESRLSSYIAPSRCLLSASGSDIVLWLNDRRESGTVHATEIRWLKFDSAAQTINVYYVTFPDDWTQTAQDLEDQEYPSNTNWNAVLATYQGNGWITSRTLVDHVAEAAVSLDEPTALATQMIEYDLAFDANTMNVPVTVSATIRLHSQPMN
jgi:type II secretory pathway pseudopilin PulG